MCIVQCRETNIDVKGSNFKEDDRSYYSMPLGEKDDLHKEGLCEEEGGQVHQAAGGGDDLRQGQINQT